MIDLVKLGYAIAVAQEGSYGAASARLGLSQPALSRSIQSLEAEYQVRLFERGRGGAKLTVAGASFLGVAQSLVQHAAVGEEQLRLMVSGRARPVNFGLGPSTAGVVLPGLLPELVADGTQIRVRIDTVSGLQLLLRQGEIDFYISGLPVGLRAGGVASDLRIKRVPASQLGVLARIGHPLAGVAVLSPEAVIAYPVACGFFLRELFSPSGLARFGLQLPSVEVDDYAMLAALARKTDFLIVASPFLARERPELELQVLPISIPVDDIAWGLVSSERDVLSPTAQRVATLILDRLARSVAENSTTAPGEGRDHADPMRL